jgi:hypothetical protein
MTIDHPFFAASYRSDGIASRTARDIGLKFCVVMVFGKLEDAMQHFLWKGPQVTPFN